MCSARQPWSIWSLHSRSFWYQRDERCASCELCMSVYAGDEAASTSPKCVTLKVHALYPRIVRRYMLGLTSNAVVSTGVRLAFSIRERVWRELACAFCVCVRIFTFPHSLTSCDALCCTRPRSHHLRMCMLVRVSEWSVNREPEPDRDVRIYF